MKLYNMNLSIFQTLSQIVVFEKGIDIEMVDIPAEIRNLGRCEDRIHWGKSRPRCRPNHDSQIW